MKILVTGGTGFLGRALSQRLLDLGHQVTAFNRRPAPDLEERGIRCVTGDLLHAAAIWDALAGQEAVFHVAGRTYLAGPYRRFYKSNVKCTWNIIEGCLAHQIPYLVYTSTPSVVFNRDSIEGGTEALPYPERFLSPYAKSKAAAEQMVLDHNGDRNLATVALRPHLIYGPGDNHLIPSILRRARKGRLLQVGDGENRVDITYIDNAVQAHVQALKKLCDGAPVTGRAFFISDGHPVKLWDWIGSLLHQLDLPPVRKKLPLAAAYLSGMMLEGLWKFPFCFGNPWMTRFLALQLARSHYFNISAAEQELDYEPVVSPPEAFTRLVAYCRSKSL